MEQEQIVAFLAFFVPSLGLLHVCNKLMHEEVLFVLFWKCIRKNNLYSTVAVGAPPFIIFTFCHPRRHRDTCAGGG